MKFHGVHAIAFDRSALPPTITGVADGCAMLSFALDANGQPVEIEVLLEHPPGNGIGDAAVRVLTRDRYAANSEVGFDTMAPTGEATRYALSIGFGHAGGRFIISRRTVPHHQPIRLGH